MLQKEIKKDPEALARPGSVKAVTALARESNRLKSF
jgi:hypothetical protein